MWLGVHLGKFRFICIIFVLFSMFHLDYLTLNFNTYQKVILGKQLILGALWLSKLHPHIYLSFDISDTYESHLASAKCQNFK
ncbi:hypothetical protein EUGRSUZ_L00492 [Eucalyptus grandis]|uniref:Uncharacterized protein n=2 Tax=Eucalyptus grandis TaxID=71139 RepID=A0ACC3KXT0_EUCGR|nr:hypothetical protein EUGRSUZ_L00492 [Eucalyptus grandis]